MESPHLACAEASGQDCIHFHIPGLPSSILEAQRQYLAWQRDKEKEGSLSFS